MPIPLQRGLTILICAGVLVPALSGCGGDASAESSSDLTEFAPADSLLFVEGAIKPEGDLKDSIESVLGRFPDGDQVGSRLIDELDASAKEEGSEFTYEDDIEPWLGERAAFFATELELKPPTGNGGSQGGVGGETTLSAGALLVETTDEEEAEDKIRQAAEEEGPVDEREYEGVSYDLFEDSSSGDMTATAVVDGVAVIGTEQGLKDAVDANGGESLSGQAEYAEFREQRGSDLFGSLFADGRAILDSIPDSPGFGAPERQSFSETYGALLDEPIMAALEVDDSQVSLDYSAAATEFTTATQSPLLDAGFADSWAALGAAGVGEVIGGFFDQASSLGLPQARFDRFDAQLQRRLGFQLSDLTGIGDVAAFAAGESIVDLQVGGIVEVPDAATRTKLLKALRTAARRAGKGSVEPLSLQGADEGFSIQVPDLPVPINVAAAGDRVVIGAGPAAQALILGEGGLTESESFKTAAAALGDGLSVGFLLDFAPIVALVESTGEDDADFQQAKPYLDALDFLVAGSQRSDDRDLARLVVGLD